MPLVFIPPFALNLPSRFAAGDLLDETFAEFLNQLQLKRVRSKLRHMYGRGEISDENAQAIANALCKQPLAAHISSSDDDLPDPIGDEALAIARDLIISRMAHEGLPPPRGLDNHAKVLLEARPEILERARKRVEARFVAAAQAMKDLK